MGMPVMQWQILAKDPDKQMEFYRELFGWSVNADNALGYRRIDTESGGRGVNGGVWPIQQGQPSSVTLYVEVEDVSAAVDKAQGLGAYVIIPPQVLPDGDELAIISDPEGIAFGLYKPAPR